MSNKFVNVGDTIPMNNTDGGNRQYGKVTRVVEITATRFRYEYDVYVVTTERVGKGSGFFDTVSPTPAPKSFPDIPTDEEITKSIKER